MSDSTGNTGTPSTPSDDAAYRDLVTRLLAMRGYGRQPQGAVLEVLPGQLPPTIGHDLPQPSGTRLVGSVVEGPVATLVYDSSQSAEEVAGEYLGALTAAGWRESQPGRHFLGGLSAGRRHARPTEQTHHWTGLAQVFRGDDDPLITVETAPAPENGHITLAVRADDDRESPLRAITIQRQNAGTPILPALTPPPTVRQMGGGGSAGSDQATSYGTVTAPTLTLARLADHYTDQLRQAGWHLDANAVETQVAWSLWSFTRDGQPWRGFLAFIVFAEQPVVRVGVDLRADLVGDPQQMGRAQGGMAHGTFSSGYSYSPLTRDGNTGIASGVSISGITLGPVSPANPPASSTELPRETQEDTDQHAEPDRPDGPDGPEAPSE